MENLIQRKRELSSEKPKRLVSKNSGISLEDNRPHSTIQKKANRSGLAENLKSEVETPRSNKMSTLKPPLASSQTVQFADNSKFNKNQRKSILAKNARKNGGYHTCEHCNFQHKLKTFATRKGKRLGDGGFHVDHISHRSKGGLAKMRNGRVLCGTCNTSRGNRDKINLTGMQKYRGIYRGEQVKDYQRLRSSRRRRNKN